jgi:hypothetical protein
MFLELFEAFKNGLKLIPSRLFRFIKKAFCSAWFYAYISVIPLIIAVAIAFLVKVITQNANAATIVFKILATVGQIIPLSCSLYISENELIDTDEDSAELCIAICVSVIVAIWLN